jgi:hypothetical protein
VLWIRSEHFIDWKNHDDYKCVDDNHSETIMKNLNNETKKYIKNVRLHGNPDRQYQHYEITIRTEKQ